MVYLWSASIACYILIIYIYACMNSKIYIYIYIYISMEIIDSDFSWATIPAAGIVGLRSTIFENPEIWNLKSEIRELDQWKSFITWLLRIVYDRSKKPISAPGPISWIWADCSLIIKKACCFSYHGPCIVIRIVPVYMYILYYIIY